MRPPVLRDAAKDDAARIEEKRQIECGAADPQKVLPTHPSPTE